MAKGINQIKAGLQFGGARPSLFEVSIQCPVESIAQLFDKVPVLCQAAQLPARTIGVIEVPYQDRKIKIAGSATYAEWTITVMNDEDFTIREGFQQWMDAINLPESNVRGLGVTSAPADYKGSASVRQLKKDEAAGTPAGDGGGARLIKFVGCWPSNVGEIALDWSSNDAVETFDVTLTYDYWISSPDNDTRGDGTYGIEPFA